jgi:flagellar assembly protein FliH
MAIRLEVFETDQPSHQPEVVVTDRGQVDEAKLASFEEGYSAGWEDAVAAQDEDRARLAADLARNLQALSFTYHEARDHVLSGLEPLLRAVATKLLPAIAREALAPLVAETLRPLAAEAAGAPLTLVINPASRSAVEGLLAAQNGPPLEIEEEPTLVEGQVHIRFARSETRVDLARAISEITAALHDFFTLTVKETTDG